MSLKARVQKIEQDFADHLALTLPRFESELLELLTKPESKVYQQLKEMWHKEQDDDR